MLAKKCLLVGIFTLLSVSLAIADPPAVHPVTGESLVIDCLRGTPGAIDGDLSDWNLEAMTPAVLDVAEQLHSGQDSWDGPEDCSGEFYLLWDDVNIYIAVVVKDDKLSMNKTGGDIWNADAVEVFFSTLNAVADHSEHYQYGLNANNQRWNWCNIDGAGNIEPDYLQIASSVTADGYICEASIEYGQMPSLDFSAGNTIGFHPVFDDTDNGDRELQMTWTGREAHDQSLGFGHMVLSDNPVSAGEVPVTIPISNAGFEDPILAEDDWTWLDVPGWTPVGGEGAGIWHVTSADFDPVVAPEGQNVLYSENAVGDAGGMAQVLTETFAANTDYTLTVEVGNSNYYYYAGYSVQLLSGGVVIAEDNDTLWPEYSKWVTSTVEYTYNPADAALVGQPLEIRLITLALDKDNPPAGEIVGVEFDNVTLSYVGVIPVNPGTEGLVAYYALDGDANDSSGNGNDGTINNLNGGLGLDGSVWVDDPERGTVISFNGTAEGAFVRAGDIPQMTLTNDFTWAFWAKHSDENTADNDIILGNRMDENAVDFVPRQFIKFTPTKFEWHMNGNGDDNLDYDDIPADVWLHHAVVKTGDQLTYYRNGIEASSGTFTQPLDFPQPLYFGGDNEAAEGENWSGLMSEVGIYNRALPAGEVRYLAGFRSTVEAGPVGHWTFDEGAGTTVADISGNGNDGIIMDNPDLENPTWIAGISGSALEFHGTGVAGTGGDFIDCGNDASLDITGPISIALWIRPDADDPEGKGLAGGETAPMAKATSDWSWQVRYGWATPTPYMGFQFNTSPRSWVYVGKNLVRNDWVHIACSYDGTTLKCYLDGVETDSTPMGEIHSSADPVLIGSDGWGSDWTGAIDDVRIYDRALSEDEILDIVADL